MVSELTGFFLVFGLTDQMIAEIKDSDISIEPFILNDFSGHVFESESDLIRGLALVGGGPSGKHRQTQYQGVTLVPVELPFDADEVKRRSIYFFGFMDFQALVSHLDEECLYGCAASRLDCRRRLTDSWLTTWWEGKKHGLKQKDYAGLRKRLDTGLREYFTSYRGPKKRGTEALKRFQLETYCKLQGSPMS